MDYKHVVLDMQNDALKVAHEIHVAISTLAGRGPAFAQAHHQLSYKRENFIEHRHQLFAQVTIDCNSHAASQINNNTYTIIRRIGCAKHSTP